MKIEAMLSARMPLALTPRGIPLSLRPFFQDYTLEEVDPAADAFTVIERTLAWGNHQELAWLFRRYRREQVVDAAREAGWWRIPYAPATRLTRAVGRQLWRTAATPR